jgi:hypothetical protein
MQHMQQPPQKVVVVDIQVNLEVTLVSEVAEEVVAVIVVLLELEELDL